MADLERLLSPPPDDGFRPCPGCRRQAGDTNCSPRCHEAAQALSSEPDYPLESQVVAIVFELNSLRLLQACWSCEGHLDHEGKVWKLPQVSFYSFSPLYPQLLSNYLDRLAFRKQLHSPWNVTFTSYGQMATNTYCLEPRLRVEPDLTMLQRDLQVIGDQLAERIRCEARAVLQELKPHGQA